MGRPKKIKTEEYYPTKEDFKAMSWCLENRIRCYPKVCGDEFKVIFEYVDSGKVKTIESPESYDKNACCKAMWRLYRHQHDSHKKRTS